MPSLIAGTRARLQMSFFKDGVLFDPQIVIYASTFTPLTVGVPETSETLTYGVDADLVKSSVGIYYVERLFTTNGTLKFTYRSTAWGEELNMEEICKVVARGVVER